MNEIVYLNIFTIGVIFSSAFYHLIISGGRTGRQKPAYFNFSIALFLLAVDIFLVSDIYTLIPLLSTTPIHIIHLARLFIELLLFSFLFLFFCYTFNVKDFITPYTLLLIAAFVLIIISIYIISFIFNFDQQLTKKRIKPIGDIVIAIVGFLLLSKFLLYTLKQKSPYQKKSKSWLFIVGYLSSIPYTYFIYFLDYGYISIPFLENNFAGHIIIIQLFSLGLAAEFNNEHKDLIELKHTLENKVIEKTRQLEDANKNKINYFVNLAHETKTPLTLISNYLEQYLTKTGITEETRIIKQNVEKLKNDMINFLDAQKLERDQVFYNHNEVCNFSTILNDALIMFKETASKKEITITGNIEDSLYIKTDPIALDRIINNLLDNAVKYTPLKGAIQVSLKKDRDKLILTVCDNGIGIIDEQLHNIFSPYHQISHEKRNTQGIGMGLYITRMIIESLRGNITVSSTPGKGSTFTVILHEHTLQSTDTIKTQTTLSPPIDTLPPAHMPAEKPYDPSRQTILIIEDNIQLLIYLKNNLENHYNVYYGTNGREALEKLEVIIKPDLIISDVMMDTMNGYTLLDHIAQKENFNDIPFIFLTAKTAIDDKIAAFSLGAIDYIHKPFNIDELYAKINTILRNQKLKKNLVEADKFATLGMLTGGICHEIANPLNLVYGPIDLLENELAKIKVLDTPNIKLYMKRIIDNIKRIEKIIESMKLFTHTKELKKETIDIHRLIDETIKLFNPVCKDRITITTHIEADITLSGDYDAFIHILTNLISNAIDAITYHGVIDIAVRIRNSRPIIIVKDTGYGIEKHQLPDIFNAFYTNKEVGKGTGLGLYIVKDLLIKMGMQINVVSEVGKGTQFVITT